MLRPALFILLCASLSWAFSPQVEVMWRGSLRQVFRGDTEGKIELRELEGKAGLYAVGAAAGLDGEITVLDGKPAIARVRGGEVATTQTFTGSAAFLMWSQVREWQPAEPLLMGADNHKQLARVIRQMARTYGINVDRPFPFLLKGMALGIQYHVVVPEPKDAPAKGPHQHPVHELQAVDEQVTIIGFHSRDHEGVLTHRGSHLHMHVITEKGLSGHIDDIIASPDLVIRFPKD